jgi:dTDP-4-dehydrorhamnose reductase
MVGRAVAEVSKQAGDETIACDRSLLDITDARRVEEVIESARPDVVINCAAWTDVDACELDPAKSDLINAIGPGNLAVASRRVDASLITISTDYVFDGRKDGFYTQLDIPNPLSAYARSKLEGEWRAQESYQRSSVVRTGFIFGTGGRNFLSKVIARARRGERLLAITDSWGTPTFALDLAQQLRRLALVDVPGVYHIVNAGEGATYEEFVRTALAAAGVENARVEPISCEALERPAPRPRNSRLRCLKSDVVGLPRLRAWPEALQEFASSTD